MTRGHKMTTRGIPAYRIIFMDVVHIFHKGPCFYGSTGVFLSFFKELGLTIQAGQLFQMPWGRFNTGLLSLSIERDS